MNKMKKVKHLKFYKLVFEHLEKKNLNITYHFKITKILFCLSHL